MHLWWLGVGRFLIQGSRFDEKNAAASLTFSDPESEQYSARKTTPQS